MTKTAELKERLMKDQTYIRLNEHEKEWAVQLLLQELQTQRESDLREVKKLKEECKDCESASKGESECYGYTEARNETLDEVIRALTPLGME